MATNCKTRSNTSPEEFLTALLGAKPLFNKMLPCAYTAEAISFRFAIFVDHCCCQNPLAIMEGALKES